MPESFEHILVIDTGGTSARSIMKKLRALGVSSVLSSAARIQYTGRTKGAIIAGNGIVLKATEGAAAEILNFPAPVMALGENAQALLIALGGEREKEAFEKRALHVEFLPDPLFASLTHGDRYFEHLPEVRLPDGAVPIARAEGQICAYRMKSANVYGAFFSVESNDPDGLKMLENFARDICKCAFDWNMESYLSCVTEKIRQRFPEGNVVAACSGGLLSTVSYLILNRALGNRCKCALVDTHLLPKGEIEQAKKVIFDACGREITVFDAREETLFRLKGVADAREKREIVYKTIHETIKNESDHVIFHAFTGEFSPVEGLFRDEVRSIGRILALKEDFLQKRPFPGAGFAVRISGEVTEKKIDMLKSADHVFESEIRSSGLDKKLWQYYASLIGTDAGAFIILHALLSGEKASGYAYRLPYDVIEKTVMKTMEICPDAEGVLYDVSGRWAPLFSL